MTIRISKLLVRRPPSCGRRHRAYELQFKGRRRVRGLHRSAHNPSTVMPAACTSADPPRWRPLLVCRSACRRACSLFGLPTVLAYWTSTRWQEQGVARSRVSIQSFAEVQAPASQRGEPCSGSPSAGRPSGLTAHRLSAGGPAQLLPCGRPLIREDDIGNSRGIDGSLVHAALTSRNGGDDPSMPRELPMSSSRISDGRWQELSASR